MKMTRRNFLSASALTLLSCQLAPAARADCLLSDLFHGADTALPPKPLTAKVMDANPFMGRSESNIHHDCYNTDSTDAILPVGICPEVNVAMEKTNPNASPAIFFDNFDNPVSPFLGGLAIRDLDAEEVRTIGFFSPAKHDGGGYLIQSSYSFVDGRNLIVCPTSHNHVLMLRATDENGTPLPVFEKVLDINIKEAAERVLGRSLEQNLLSIVFDYDGNLWFVTGGFRIYPSRGQQGAMGYISHNAIDAILAGGTADLDHEVHVYAPAPGEGAENGIASCREGAVILTNLACYLLRANGGVEVVWRTPYDSVGAKDSREGAATTGGGLAWGGGCSPSLSRELVFFTDNLETVSLMAVDIHTGEVAASHPVIDELPANMPVSVENSAIVYDHGNGRVSTIVCNWFGAGSPNLAKPDSDSSIQSYENIYDRNWLLKGNCMIMPGVERVDTIRTADGWTMKSIWCRDDLSDTSMMKLSTATGYIYGFVQDVDSGMWQYIVLDFDTGKTVLTVDVASLYGYNNMAIGMYAGRDGNKLYCPTGYIYGFVQDVDSGMWQYIVLDFDTGKTVLTVDVASLYGYNNMAIGMYAGRDGNKLYCPTGYKELLRLQDRFVFLPEMPYRKVDLDKTSRRVLSAAEFQAAGGAGTPASWLHTATLDNLHPATTVSFRINGLTGNAADYKLFALGTDGRYHEVSDWHFDDAPARLSAKKVYTICLTAQDGGSFDLSPDTKEVTLSIVLAR